jgi:hypothetical protein
MNRHSVKTAFPLLLGLILCVAGTVNAQLRLSDAVASACERHAPPHVRRRRPRRTA